MRILYTSVSSDIRKLNSAESHFIEVARNLSKIGNDLLVLVAAYTPFEKVDYGFNIKLIPTGRRRFLSYLWAELIRVIYLPFLVLIWRPDVIYARKDRFDFFPPIWARLLRIPYVIEVNGIIEDESKMYKVPKWEILVSKLAEKVNYALSTKIVCITVGIKRELIKRYNIEEKKLAVISNGANTDLFLPLDKQGCRRRRQIDEDAFYVGFIGSFEPWQGLETLLESAKQVKERGYSKIKYLLVGDGTQAPILKQKVRDYHLEHDIKFIGRIPYEEVVYYINSFDVCYLCKEKLSFGFSPLKLYEYLACGKPVIASRVEGITEVIEEGKCGFLFEPGSAEELAQIIVRCFKEKRDLDPLGASGRKLVEERYSWQVITHKISMLLQ